MLDLSPALLFSGVLLSAIGMILFLSGKRDARPASLLAGMALCGLPVFVHGLLALWLTSAGVLSAWAWLSRNAD